MAEEHIYRKFDEDLEDIRANVIQMGAIIEEQIRNAIQSLEQIDPQLAQKVINRDEDVNDLETLIEEECSLFIAKRAPQAKDFDKFHDRLLRAYQNQREEIILVIIKI